MPTTVTREAVRIALAHSECGQFIAEVEREITDHLRALRQQHAPVDETAWQMILDADMTYLELVYEMDVHRWHRDRLIRDGTVVIIEDDGKLRWLEQVDRPIH